MVNSRFNRKTSNREKGDNKSTKEKGFISSFSHDFLGKLKFKIKNHRITAKTEFLDPTHKLFGKKNWEHFWSKFAPPKFLFVEYHRVTLKFYFEGFVKLLYNRNFSRKSLVKLI
jgi:hypothetical protein